MFLRNHLVFVFCVFWSFWKLLPGDCNGHNDIEFRSVDLEHAEFLIKHINSSDANNIQN